MQRSLKIDTHGQGFYEITEELRAFAAGADKTNAMLHVFIQHTSASLLIQENADPNVLEDLSAHFRALAPEDARYKHDDEGPDDMPAHIKSAHMQTSLSIPLSNGDLLIGRWQGVYVVEHRRSPHRRSVVLTVT